MPATGRRQRSLPPTGVPATDSAGNEIRPGLDPRYGAITDVALLVVEPDGSRHGTVVSVGPVTPEPVHGPDGRTGFEVLPQVAQYVIKGIGPVTSVTTPDVDHLLASVTNVLRGQATSDTIVVGWNSSVFGLPFLHDRAIQRVREHVPLGLELVADESLFVKYDPLPGHGGYRARIRDAAHLDIQEPFRAWAEANGVTHSLKPVAIAHGLDPIEVDRERMHELSLEQRVAYVLSDADVTATLAIDFTDELGLASLVDRVRGDHRLRA